MNTELCAVRVETLGCRLNQVESESFAALCVDAGFSIYNETSGVISMNGGINTASLAAAPQFIKKKAMCLNVGLSADAVMLCLVNTCTVTGKAEQKARRLIRGLTKEHPYTVILVTGCYAQLEAAEIEALHPHVIAFPGRQKDLLISVPAFFAELVRSCSYPDTAFFLSGLRTYLCGLTETAEIQPKQLSGNATSASEIPAAESRLWNLSAKPKELFALSSSRFLFHSRALLKIQDGCNNACAYCRIRLARGRAQSLPAEEVINRLKHIEAAGIPEVTLSGVNLSQYSSGEDDFAGLLARILQSIGIRIRISSLYPDRIDAAILPLLAHPLICPHFHLSVQSGSDTILKAMHRRYTRDTVYEAVAALRRVKNNPFIGVDIITGFPGETEADFEDTYRMCRELRFAGIHAFPFSARPGTEAWNMQPKVPERIAGQRVKKLAELAEKQALDYRHSWHGQLVYGVMEAPHNNHCTVLTENYLSLPLTERTERSAYSFRGGEYVQVRVCVDSAELVELIGTPKPYNLHR